MRKYIKTFESHDNDNSVSDKILELNPKDNQYVFIIQDGQFIDSDIIYYHNKKYYKGSKSEVSKTVKSKGGGKPTKEEYAPFLKELKEKNKNFIFNLRLDTKYGNWIISGDIVKKPKVVNIEYVQMIVDIIMG